MKKRQQKKQQQKQIQQEKKEPLVRRKTTATKKTEFLKQYSENGNITKSAEFVGIDRATHYRWLKEDPEYMDRFKEADTEFADNLEAEARRRAWEGYDEPVFYQGMKVGQVRKYSDTLLIFLLKGAKPERYKDRLQQDTKHTGQMQLDLSNLSIEDLEKLANMDVEDND